jgi:predicted DCC family thiol-disulfide oxidoreductase YuxK
MVILFFDGDCGLCNHVVVHLSSEQTDAPYHSLLVLAGSAVYEKEDALKKYWRENSRTRWAMWPKLD